MCLCVSFLGRDAVLRACRPCSCCIRYFSVVELLHLACICVSSVARGACLRASRPWSCCVLCASERVLWRAALPCEREGRGVVAFRVHQRELLGAQRLLAGVKAVELLHWACICVTVVSWHMTLACVRAGRGVDRIRRFSAGVKAVELLHLACICANSVARGAFLQARRSWSCRVWHASAHT
jgi:hypothetical protein